MFQIFVFTTLLALSANGFVVVDQRKATSTCNTSSSSSSSSQLLASRRDFLSNTATATAAILVFPTVAGAATTAEKIADTPKKQAETKDTTVSGSFQGVFSDPKHPKGYRVIVAKGSAATMSLSDGGADSKLFNLPVKVNKGKDGTTTLTIDFSPKGGPKNIIGTLANDGSSISFPDGNKWKKNVGLEGVYKSSKNSQYRVIRKDKGSSLIVELRDNKLPTLIMAKSGASKKEGVYVDIQFPVKVKADDVKANSIKGSFDNGIISFPDGNKWTKM